MKVEKDNKVTIEYEGKLENGEVFDTSKGKDPLQFIAGSGMVIKGFDEAILGMSEDQEKEFTLESEEAYGSYNDKLIKEVPRDFIPKDKPVEKGMMIALGTPDGKQFPARIVEVDNAFIKVDLNHPLAGKKLTFKIKVVKVEENTCKGDSDKECCGGHDDHCSCEAEKEESCGCEAVKEETKKKDDSVEDLV